MRSPERQRELTFMVRAESGREHVNFYDVGFSVPKSVSLLQVGWMAAAAEARAAGDLDRAAECEAKAEEIEQVVHGVGADDRAARRDSTCTSGPGITARRRGNGGTPLACPLRCSCITRRGPRTVKRSATRSCTRTSRSGRTRSAADGADSTYRSIDAPGLYQMQSYYAAVAELEMEQRLQRLGYAIVRTPNGDFEVGGLHDPKVIKAFSSRTSEITEELAPHVQAFIERNGRAPSRATLRAMCKNATMKTRQPKEHAPDQARQHAVWDAKYRAATLQALTDIPVTAADYAAAAAAVRSLMQCTVHTAPQAALATLQQQRATWSWPHLALEIRKTLPVLPANVRETDVDALVAGDDPGSALRRGRGSAEAAGGGGDARPAGQRRIGAHQAIGVRPVRHR